MSVTTNTFDLLSFTWQCPSLHTNVNIANVFLIRLPRIALPLIPCEGLSPCYLAIKSTAKGLVLFVTLVDVADFRRKKEKKAQKPT